MNNKNSTFTANHDDLEPQLESAVWAVLSEPLPADAIARVKSQALALEEITRSENSTFNSQLILESSMDASCFIGRLYLVGPRGNDDVSFVVQCICASD